MSGRQRLVVVGNGMVGLRFLEEIVGAAPGRFDITAIGAEPRAAYNRVLLSPLLAGEITSDDVAMRPQAWYGENGIGLRLGRAAIGLDMAGRSVRLDGGESVPFDVCVLATGSQPIRLPVPGAGLAGVKTFRDFDDVTAFRAVAQSGRPAVVIGGGLLGIETAYGLARAGCPVTLVHLMDRLMERQLDAEGAEILAGELSRRGIALRLSAETEAIIDDGSGAVAGIRLKTGEVIDAAIVVMAVGVKPETGLARAAGLDVGRGIKIDDGLETSGAGVFAIGECAEHAGVCYGLVEPGYAQARILARRLAGDSGGAFKGTTLATNLKVSGVAVFSAGDFSGAGAEGIVSRDIERGAYRKLFVRDGRLAGVVLVGDTADALWYRDLIGEQRDVGDIRSGLAFGRAFAEAA